MVVASARVLAALFGCSLAGLAAGQACGGDERAADIADSAAPVDDATAADSEAPDVAADVATDVSTDAAPDDVSVSGCDRPFAPGPYGTHRGDRADDVELALAGGGSWRLSDVLHGCEVVVVLPDTQAISSLDPRSIWDDEPGLADLVRWSPQEVHYLFVSNDSDADRAGARIAAMRARLDTVLGRLDPAVAEHWRGRLHVAAARAQDLADWLGSVLTTHFRTGLAIGRDQRLYGIGMLADVARYDQALADTGEWAWANNIGYAANEAVYLHAEAERSAALAAETGLVVDLWRGEVLAEKAETDVVLPADLSPWDTLQVEVTSRCPDADKLELDDNCGAWDYIASLYLREGSGDAAADVEVARFITSYHRESHWIVDATALLPRLAGGGTRHFLWTFAPSWNTQPTATTLRLVFGKRAGRAGRVGRPTTTTALFQGGEFNAAYNSARPAMKVAIPAGAKKVELWAITTGHGAGTQQCAEFCAHQHQFTVDGKLHIQTFRSVGQDDGCVGEAARGMVPNQAGTWWFGRGGWCPGAAVTPWIVDVTADVTPGQEATIGYRGLLAGKEPPDGAGTIALTSYLVVYE